MIKDLRKENAEARKKNGSLSDAHGKLKTALVEAGLIEDDEADPEEKLKGVTAQNEQIVVNSAILEAALENGVSKADLKYFRFLVHEKLAELEDDQELDSDMMAELAKQARRTQAGSGGASSTSVTQGAPSPGGSSEVTVEQFTRMNIGEKSDLFARNRAQYDKLMAEARDKRILV
jgi:hypothetical protein